MDVSVVTSGHDVADARLHRLVGALRREGLSVEVFGLGDPAHGPQGVETRATPRPGMAGRGLLAVRYARAARGRVLLVLDPDAAVVAWVAARLRRRRVVIDVHEDYEALLTDRAWAHGPADRAARVVVAAATAVAARADLTLVADEHVPPRESRRRLVVTNEADPSLVPPVDEMAPAATPRAAYVGDLRASRGLFAMLETVRTAPSWHLDLVGPVAAADQEALTRVLAADPDLAARVHLHGRCPPAQAWRIVAGAWVGLALLEDTAAFRAAMPSKVLEYLACGLPVLTTDLARPAALVRDSGAGAVVAGGTPAQVGARAGAVLLDLAATPDLLASWRTAAAAVGRERAGHASPYDAAARAVHELVDAPPRPTVAPALRRYAVKPRAVVRGVVHATRSTLSAPLRPGSPVRGALPAPAKQWLRAFRRHLPARVAGVLDSAAGNGSSISLPQPSRPAVPPGSVRLLVAPANFAGQGDAWARAVRANLPGVSSVSMMTDNKFGFPVDYEVSPEVYRNRAWQLDQRRWVIDEFTHVLVEAERPPFGPLYGPSAAGDVAQLLKHGLTVGMICHGSDVRVPSLHHARFPYSPFDDPDDRTTTILEARTTANVAFLTSFEGPVFVSTPDLLDWVPTATWCPVVVDPESWATEQPLLERDVPRVVHVPSSSRLKGSELVDPVMRELADEGLIEYVSVRDLPHAELRRVYQDSDIVLDQFVLGLYGVAAAEGMAAGRVVVAFVTDQVRARVREATGLEVPIVEADPESVRDVVMRIVDDRATAREAASHGPAFVRAVHDGRHSARVLEALLRQ